jgi:FMN phosphatase YigB (HAD superfamily)
VIRAILYDLDNTLLQNPMSQFIPAYLQALGEYMADRFAPQVLIRHLLNATEVMVQNTDPQRSNAEVFDAAFFPALRRQPPGTGAALRRLLRHSLPHPAAADAAPAAARPLIEWSFAHGFQVVIATNPLFPLTAILQRLDWAGVPASEFPYDLITSYEIMHAAKPHPAYYHEIARRIGRMPEECLLVGDDWEGDIRPAQSIGMAAYWIAAPDAAPPADPPPAGQGSLEDLARWVQTLPDPR